MSVVEKLLNFCHLSLIGLFRISFYLFRTFKISVLMMSLLDRYTDFLLIVNSVYKVPRILEIYVRELPRYVQEVYQEDYYYRK